MYMYIYIYIYIYIYEYNKSIVSDSQLTLFKQN